MTDTSDEAVERLAEHALYINAPVTASTIRALRAERDRLKAGLLAAMQYENKCDQTGQPCGETERCSCFLQANVWCNSTKESRHD
jgi:hypothetical protein